MAINLRGFLDKFLDRAPRKGPTKNKYSPRPTLIRNPKIAAHVSAMFEKWEREQFPSRVTKSAPTPKSITQIKLQHHCKRHLARMLQMTFGGADERTQTSV